jgi:phage terminase large subunit-like protein
LQTWALQGQGIKIGEQQFQAAANTPAVIDTGTSLFALPANLFDKLAVVWREELGQ